MRILVLGGSGMLGHKMFQTLGQRFPDTWCTIRGRIAGSPLDRIPLFTESARMVENMDVMALGALDGQLAALRPDVVVNCVGIVKQRGEAKAAIPSITVNSLLPHRLAAALQPWNGRLVHISTDCVFNGRRGAYTEDDLPDAEDLYGRTKALGEVTESNALTLRTSMIGRELTGHRSLLDWVLAQQGRTISGYRKAFYSGVTTNELAWWSARLIEERPALNGLYQIASDTITKYDLLRLIVEAFGLDVKVVADDAFFCDRSLNGTRFEAAAAYHCEPWPALIAALRADATPYDAWTRSV